jgi:hypothetical protein
MVSFAQKVRNFRLASARRALSTALPDTLVGRTSQLQQLNDFLQSNLCSAAAPSKKGKKDKGQLKLKWNFLLPPLWTATVACGKS